MSYRHLSSKAKVVTYVWINPLDEFSNNQIQQGRSIILEPVHLKYMQFLSTVLSLYIPIFGVHRNGTCYKQIDKGIILQRNFRKTTILKRNFNP